MTAKKRRNNFARSVPNRIGHALAIACTLGFSCWAYADLPTGATPRSGITFIDVNGNVMQITANQLASMVDWQSFSVGAGNTVYFQLPNGNARILNRVVGNDPSNIHGTISSNGSVFLVNPAGVTFHSGATLDVAGFYAAAGKISDSDFLSGNLHFTDVEGMVHVKPGAVLEANVLHLIGERIVNEGMLRTSGSNGIIGMFAGNDVLIGEENGRVFAKVDGHLIDGISALNPGGNPYNVGGMPGIDNKGVIDVGAGRAILGAGDIYSLAIRNTGQILAPGGEINIAAAQGTVHNSGILAGGSITLDGAGIHLDSDIDDTDDINFRGPVILDNSVTITAPSIVFLSTIDALNDGSQSLGLFGNAQFHAPVGMTGRLFTLLVDGSLFIGPNGTDIHTLGNQTYRGTMTVGGDALLTADAGLVFFNAAIDALSEGSHGLTVDGALRIDGNIGNSQALKELIAKGVTIINTDSIRTIGEQQYQGQVILAVSSQLEGSQVWFWQPLNAQPFGDQGLTILGNARFDGQVGGMANRELAYLDISGATLINTDLIRTSGMQTYGGNITLGDALVTLQGSDIWFQSLVNAQTTGAQALQVLGNAQFDGNVGANQSLASLFVDGNSLINGVLIQTNGNQHYLGNVVVDGNSTLRGLNGGSLVMFESAINDASAGQSQLLIDGNAQFGGQIGQTAALNSLSVTGSTLINTNAITTTSLQSYAGPVDLASNATLTSHVMDFGSTIDGAHSLTLNVGDTLRLGGDVGGNQRLARLEINAGGITTIEGSRILATGDIRFNPLGTALTPDIATFAGMNGLLIDSTNGSFFMGENQKLSVLGDLTINALNGSATLGDLNSLGSMTVNAPSIFLQTRLPGQVLLSDGSRITDFGLDFIAGGPIRFSSMPQALRSGIVLFATQASGANAIDIAGASGPFLLLSGGQPVTLERFFFGNIVLDLTAPVTQQDNLAEQLADAAAEFEDTLFPDPLRLILLETLQNMNVNVRDLSSAEYGERLTGRDIYDDSANAVPAMAGTPGTGGPVIAANRLRRPSVITVVDTYIDLFVDGERDPETGELTNIVDRRPEMRESFNYEWLAYREYADEPTTDGFRNYLLNGTADPEAEPTQEEISARRREVARCLRGLEHIYQELSIIGLTRAEFEMAVRSLLEPITPEGVEWRELRSLMAGSQL